MALEEAIFQHDYTYNYTGEEAYSNIYREDEQSFYDLQASLNFFDNQNQNSNTSVLQEDYYKNNKSLSHQPFPENVSNEAKISQDYCDMTYNRDSKINAMGNTKATRGRTRMRKNKEEINNQRMTHIAVERNRRKLMNEYLSVLRSLMPESYVQRCDQASIVGGAINFIRETEHRLHPLSFNGEPSKGGNISSATPFSDSFKHPQFSMGSCAVSEDVVLEVNALADIEVSLVESHASLKIRSRKRRKLLLNLVSGLQSLGFMILHLNVSTVSDFILYCFATKMEDHCKLTSAADIASSVYEMIRILHDS